MWQQILCYYFPLPVFEHFISHDTWPQPPVIGLLMLSGFCMATHFFVLRYWLRVTWVVLRQMIMIYSTNHVYLHRPNAFGFWQMRLHLCLNWLKNSKRVWHEPKLHISRLHSFRKFWSVICERLVGLVSFKTNVSETAGQIHLSDTVRCNGA